ncbi:DUF6297 family protein, partial [Actinomadura adrarensis]
GSDRLLTLAHLVVPATGAVLWTSITAALVPGISVLAAAISAAGGLLVTYRMATRPPMDYGGSLVDFGVLGLIPVSLISQPARGPALLAVLCLVQMAVQ